MLEDGNESVLGNFNTSTSGKNVIEIQRQLNFSISVTFLYPFWISSLFSTSICSFVRFVETTRCVYAKQFAVSVF